MSNEQESGSSGQTAAKCQPDLTGNCQHVFFLQQQSRYIDDLRSQLSAIMAERDLLLCEVSRLKFELEIADIKRINDDRLVEIVSINTLLIILLVKAELYYAIPWYRPFSLALLR